MTRALRGFAVLCRISGLLLATILLLATVACRGEQRENLNKTPEPSPVEPARPAVSSINQPAIEPADTPPAITSQPTIQPTNHPTIQPATETQPAETAPLYEPLDPDLPPPPTAVPAPVPLLPPDDTVTLLALLGNDVDTRKGGRTDSIILTAVNQDARTIRLLSIPRDLYVAIPGWTMGRINQAYAHGGEAGSDLFKETIAYNLGLPVDHTVRVGFNGFTEIVDALGGIEVVVNCPVKDWRLKSPHLDPQLEENWEPFELSYGIQQMDGDLALWYARSRRSSTDFDRGRRQQKILRALRQKTASSDLSLDQLLALVRALWPYVDSDLSLGETVSLAALAPQLDRYTLHSLLLPPEALRSWTVPGSGESVQLLDWETAEPTLRAFLSEPALNTAASKPPRVAIQSKDYVLYRQAAENLAWYGFEAIYDGVPQEVPEETAVTYYGPSLKGASAGRLAWILRQDTAEFQLQPRPAGETIDYHVILAPDYNPCLDYLSGQ